MKWKSLMMPKGIQIENPDKVANYGRIIIEPLERGWGHTIGNTLRRILLSSLQGAAVVSVRIDNVQHEYSTIEGVVDFTGKAPTPGKLHREADPFCAKEPMTDPTVLTKGGKLQNVWVHVTKGAKEAAKPPATITIPSTSKTSSSCRRNGPYTSAWSTLATIAQEVPGILRPAATTGTPR
jgi:hypothetical protein